MTKVAFYELPLNVRLACIPLWGGMISIFFYSLATKLSELHGSQINNLGLLSFGLYLGVFFLLKRKKQTTFMCSSAILAATTAYNLFQIYQSYAAKISPLGLTVWWPLIHSSAFGISLILISLPASWNYYKK